MGATDINLNRTKGDKHFGWNQFKPEEKFARRYTLPKIIWSRLW